MLSSPNSVQKSADTRLEKLDKGKRHIPKALLQWSASVAVTLLISLFLSWIGVTTQIDTQLAQIGFDTDRIFLLTSLLLVLLSSLCAGMFTRRGSAAWLGGLILFVIRYLFPFVQQALHPGLSPAGQKQILLLNIFIGVIFTSLALCTLCAGAGAALGVACGRILLGPLVALSQRLLARFKRISLSQTLPSVQVSLSLLAAGALVVGALICSALGAGPLLTYGPTTNLYQPVQNVRKPVSGPPLPTTGTVLSGTFKSPALGRQKRTYWIYLPPSYSVMTTRRYPTFYLLHGSPGGPDDWFKAAHAATTADALIDAGKMRETIMVGVDGNGSVYHFSEWANSFDKRQHMEDALVQDLIPFIDQHYRTLANASERAIGGLSMGGYGAVNIALHHPDVFRAVMSVGGYFQAEGPVFGSGVGSSAYRRLNSPALLLQTPIGQSSASELSFVIGVGTSDGRYYGDGLAFYKQLRALGLNVQLLTAVGGHSWTVWAQQFGEVLPLLEPPDNSVNVYPSMKNQTSMTPLTMSFACYCCRPSAVSRRNFVEEV